MGEEWKNWRVDDPHWVNDVSVGKKEWVRQLCSRGSKYWTSSLWTASSLSWWRRRVECAYVVKILERGQQMWNARQIVLLPETEGVVQKLWGSCGHPIPCARVCKGVQNNFWICLFVRSGKERPQCGQLEHSVAGISGALDTVGWSFQKYEDFISSWKNILVFPFTEGHNVFPFLCWVSGWKALLYQWGCGSGRNVTGRARFAVLSWTEGTWQIDKLTDPWTLKADWRVKLDVWSVTDWFSPGWSIDVVDCRARFIWTWIHLCEIMLHIHASMHVSVSSGKLDWIVPVMTSEWWQGTKGLKTMGRQKVKDSALETDDISSSVGHRRCQCADKKCLNHTSEKVWTRFLIITSADIWELQKIFDGKKKRAVWKSHTTTRRRRTMRYGHYNAKLRRSSSPWWSSTLDLKKSASAPERSVWSLTRSSWRYWMLWKGAWSLSDVQKSLQRWSATDGWLIIAFLKIMASPKTKSATRMMGTRTS